MPQRRRWLVVDGPFEARQAYGRIVSLQLRRIAARRLPTLEPECESHDQRWRRFRLTPKQCPSCQTNTHKGEDVQEALHRLCRCRRAQSCCCCPPNREGWRHLVCQRKSEDPQAVFFHETLLYRKPRYSFTAPESKTIFGSTRCVSPAHIPPYIYSTDTFSRSLACSPQQLPTSPPIAFSSFSSASNPLSFTSTRYISGTTTRKLPPAISCYIPSTSTHKLSPSIPCYIASTTARTLPPAIPRHLSCTSSPL